MGRYARDKAKDKEYATNLTNECKSLSKRIEELKEQRIALEARIREANGNFRPIEREELLVNLLILQTSLMQNSALIDAAITMCTHQEERIDTLYLAVAELQDKFTLEMSDEEHPSLDGKGNEIG